MTVIVSEFEEPKKMYPLTNDAMMKQYFTRDGNIEQLRQFIKATTHLTDDDLIKVEINKSTLTKYQVDEKDFIVDVRLTSATGHQINIEVQVENHANFIERMVSYNARQYSSQLDKGDDYIKLKEAISIVVVNFPLFNDTDEFFEHILFRRKNGKVFTNAQQFYIMDLTKKLSNESTDTKNKWAALFKAESEDDLKMLMQDSDEMKKAAEKLIELNEDKDVREMARARADSQKALKMTIYAERDEERAKAEAEKLEIAKKMIQHGINIKDVIEITGLSAEVISNI